jgi:hypothetical protein
MVCLLFIQSEVLSTLVTQSDVDFVKVYYVLCFGFGGLRQLKLSLVTSVFQNLFRYRNVTLGPVYVVLYVAVYTATHTTQLRSHEFY